MHLQHQYTKHALDRTEKWHFTNFRSCSLIYIACTSRRSTNYCIYLQHSTTLGKAKLHDLISVSCY